MAKKTKVLGLVKAIHVGTTAPASIYMLWYNLGDSMHYYYNVNNSAWEQVAAADGLGGIYGGSGSLDEHVTVNGLGGYDLHFYSMNTFTVTSVEFKIGSLSEKYATFNVSGLSANRTVTFQDKSGTVAYLSDIAASNELSEILANGNTTGGTDIIMSDDDLILAASGGGQLNLREGADNVISLTNDNANYGKAWYYGDDTNTWIGFGNDVDLLMNSAEATLRGNNVVIWNNDTGSPFFTVRGATSHNYKLLFTKTASAIDTVITFQDDSGTVAFLSDITTALGNYLPLAGGTMAGHLNTGGYQLQGGQFQSATDLFYLINNSAFAAILDTSGITSNKTLTIQDKDHTVAGLDDITDITVGTIVTDSGHTGDTSVTVVDSIHIPADTYAAGDLMEIIALYYKDGSSETQDLRIYINEANSLDGSQQLLATYSLSNRAAKMYRTFFCKTDGTYNLRGTTNGGLSSSNDFGDSNYTISQRGYTVDFSVDQYILFTTQLSVGSETSTLEGAIVKRKRG